MRLTPRAALALTRIIIIINTATTLGDSAVVTSFGSQTNVKH